jgi:WD40 repeat protein
MFCVTHNSSVDVFSSEDGSLVKTIQTDADLSKIGFSKDGRYLFTQSETESIGVWDFDSGVLVNTVNTPDYDNAVYDTTEDGRMAYAAVNEVVVLDFLTNEPLAQFPIQETNWRAKIIRVFFGGDFLLVNVNSGTIEIYSLLDYSFVNKIDDLGWGITVGDSILTHGSHHTSLVQLGTWKTMWKVDPDNFRCHSASNDRKSIVALDDDSPYIVFMNVLDGSVRVNDVYRVRSIPLMIFFSQDDTVLIMVEDETTTFVDVESGRALSQKEHPTVYSAVVRPMPVSVLL